jgi:hypothetical protein
MHGGNVEVSHYSKGSSVVVGSGADMCRSYRSPLGVADRAARSSSHAAFRGCVFSRFCDFADFRFCVKPGLRNGAHALLQHCGSAHPCECVNPVPCFSGFAESRIAGFTKLRTSGSERQCVRASPASPDRAVVLRIEPRNASR